MEKANIIEKISALNDNEEFSKKIINSESYEEAKAIYAVEGVNIEEILDIYEDSVELSDETLDNVSGGASKAQVREYLKALYKQIKLTGAGKNTLGTLKWGASYGVLLTASVDAFAGNPYKHFNYSRIKSAADTLGFWIP